MHRNVVISRWETTTELQHKSGPGETSSAWIGCKTNEVWTIKHHGYVCRFMWINILFDEAFKYSDGVKLWGHIATSAEPLCVEFSNFVQCHISINHLAFAVNESKAGGLVLFPHNFLFNSLFNSIIRVTQKYNRKSRPLIVRGCHRLRVNMRKLHLE
jgi:hypothetical protein